MNSGYYRKGYNHGRVEGEEYMQREAVNALLEEVVIGHADTQINQVLKKVAERISDIPLTVRRTPIMKKLKLV